MFAGLASPSTRTCCSLHRDRGPSVQTKCCVYISRVCTLLPACPPACSLPRRPCQQCWGGVYSLAAPQQRSQPLSVARVAHRDGLGRTPVPAAATELAWPRPHSQKVPACASSQVTLGEAPLARPSQNAGRNGDPVASGRSRGPAEMDQQLKERRESHQHATTSAQQGAGSTSAAAEAERWVDDAQSRVGKADTPNGVLPAGSRLSGLGTAPTPAAASASTAEPGVPVRDQPVPLRTRDAGGGGTGTARPEIKPASEEDEERQGFPALPEIRKPRARMPPVARLDSADRAPLPRLLDRPLPPMPPSATRSLVSNRAMSASGQFAFHCFVRSRAAAALV